MDNTAKDDDRLNAESPSGFHIQGSGIEIINCHSVGYETGFRILGQNHYLHGNTSRFDRSPEDTSAGDEDRIPPQSPQ